jgi:hypothetical protein
VTSREVIKMIRDAQGNYTNEFFEKFKDAYREHFNTIRSTLSREGTWNGFDRAFCEWARPGQVSLIESAKRGNKAVCNDVI